MLIHYKDKQIEVLDLEYDMNDYPDFTDCAVLSAVWADTSLPLTTEELDCVNEDCGDAIYELVLNRLF